MSGTQVRRMVFNNWEHLRPNTALPNPSCKFLRMLARMLSDQCRNILYTNDVKVDILEQRRFCTH